MDWSPVLASTCPADALSLWESIFLSSVKAFVPHSSAVSRAKNKPWHSSYLCCLRRQRDRLFHRSKRLTSGHHLSLAYRKVRNFYVAELRAAERLYYLRQGAKLSSSNMVKNSHRWWILAKAACGLQSKDIIPPLASNGVIHWSSQEKAECLNAVFAEQCNVSCRASDTLLPVVSPTVTTNVAFEPVSTVAVYKRLSSLNIYKASGLDDIPNVLLKECATTIAKPLAHVFNLSLQSGCFPSAWKWAKVEPVYKKKGDRSDPKSYRNCPTSLHLKGLESLVGEQLLVHCLSVNAIPDEQFGFLPKRSTTWQLLSFFDDSERALGAGQSVHGEGV